MELRADAAQRPVGLGSQQQDGQRGLQAEVAGREAQAHRDGDQGDRQRGDELEHRRRGEGQLQDVAVRTAVAVGDLADPRRLGARPPVGHQGRQTPDHVDEVAGQLRQRLPLPLRAVPGRQPDEDGEDRHEREGERDDDRAGAVLGGQGEQGEHGQDAGHDERGQVAREVGLDRGDPTSGQHRHLAGPAAGQLVRVQVERPAQDGAAQRRPHDPGGACGDRVDDRRQRHAGQGERQQGDGGAVPPRAGGVGDDPHHQRGQRERVRHDQGADRALGQDDHDQLDPGGPQVGQDAWVQGPHAEVPASSAVGMWWTAMRWRKTQ